jgi:hypothetical protein
VSLPKCFPSITIERCVALLVAAAVAGGCSRAVTMQTWQNGVERYVRDNGNDPAVLRDVTLSGGQGGRRGFGVIGKNDPRASTDVNGVLVAHEGVAGQERPEARPWFIYLVGIVEKQKVREIRLAALSFSDGRPTWRIGPKDAEALKRYRDDGLGQWRQRLRGQGTAAQEHAGRVPPDYTTFPRPADAFDAKVSGSSAEATHATSGARWEVQLGTVKP